MYVWLEDTRENLEGKIIPTEVHFLIFFSVEKLGICSDEDPFCFFLVTKQCFAEDGTNILKVCFSSSQIASVLQMNYLVLF